MSTPPAAPESTSAAALPAGPRHATFSLGRVWAIASNTLLELIRLKVFYFMVIFAVAIIGSSLFLVKLSFQEQFQVLKDVSLGAMSIFTWLLAVLSTAMLLPKDVEDRTLYTILAKPVPRFEYPLGKLLGVLVMLAASLFLMSIVFVIVLYSREQTVLAEAVNNLPPELAQVELAKVKASTWNWNLIPGVLVIYLKAALCASLTLLLSTFASSWIFTIMISISVYFIGHLQGIARSYWLGDNAVAASGLVKVFLALVALFFPDLQIFSLVDDIAVGAAVPTWLFIKTAALGSIYVVVYLLIGYFVFAKREL